VSESAQGGVSPLLSAIVTPFVVWLSTVGSNVHVNSDTRCNTIFPFDRVTVARLKRELLFWTVTDCC
jgi:hypothetical protein